jgi:fucose permease
VWKFVPESEHWLRERHASSSPTRVSDIFAPGLASRTVLGTLAAACALTGYWGTNSWLPTYLMRERGLDTASMGKFVVLLNLGMFVGYLLLGWLADQISRRRALLICFAGATVLLPAYALLRDNTVLFWMGPLLALFFAYAGLFGAYFPELYPTRMRTLGAGFCFNVGRGIAAFSPYVLGRLADRVGLADSIALSALGFLGAGLIMLALPEDPARASPA